ncbi:unnamed protein product [Amoebophrya sp. A120]|nr:unnamed protein product [Amoebophrya sp. A120]|eukprot:GSA120T00009804001.1
MASSKQRQRQPVASTIAEASNKCGDTSSGSSSAEQDVSTATTPGTSNSKKRPASKITSKRSNSKESVEAGAATSSGKDKDKNKENNAKPNKRRPRHEIIAAWSSNFVVVAILAYGAFIARNFYQMCYPNFEKFHPTSGEEVPFVKNFIKVGTELEAVVELISGEGAAGGGKTTSSRGSSSTSSDSQSRKEVWRFDFKYDWDDLIPARDGTSSASSAAATASETTAEVGKNTDKKSTSTKSVDKKSLEKLNIPISIPVEEVFAPETEQQIQNGNKFYRVKEKFLEITVREKLKDTTTSSKTRKPVKIATARASLLKYVKKEPEEINNWTKRRYNLLIPYNFQQLTETRTEATEEQQPQIVEQPQKKFHILLDEYNEFEEINYDKNWFEQQEKLCPEKKEVLQKKQKFDKENEVFKNEFSVIRGLPKMQLKLVFDEDEYPWYYFFDRPPKSTKGGKRYYQPMAEVDMFWLTDDQLTTFNGESLEVMNDGNVDDDDKPENQGILPTWLSKALSSLFSSGGSTTTTAAQSQSKTTTSLTAAREDVERKPKITLSEDSQTGQKSLNFTTSLHFSLMSAPRWRFQKTMEERLQATSASFGENSEEALQLRDLFANTSPTLLIVTLVVSILHTIFEFLAFKADVQFWSNQSAETLNKYVSVTSVLLNIVFETILLLYLYDQGSNFLVLLFSLVSIVIECWKVTRAMTFDCYWLFGKIPLPKMISNSGRKEGSQDWDWIAIKYLSTIFGPIVLSYATYSLLYECHKSYYSFLLETAASCVYAGGFILMTPQLFINYKLKSVAFLPWKRFIYRALNTFVDDLFSFIIRMPTMHRMGCFRDDVVFFVYLYQRWIYPVDKNRLFDDEDDVGGTTGDDVVVDRGELPVAALDATTARTLLKDSKLQAGSGAEQSSSNLHKRNVYKGVTTGDKEEEVELSSAVAARKSATEQSEDAKRK